MKLKNYSNFVETRLVKEEFIGKLWRGITGENSERIKSFTDLLNKIKEEVKNKFSEKLNQYGFSETEKEEVKKSLLAEWGEFVRIPTLTSIVIGDSTLSNLLYYLIIKDDVISEIESLKDLDGDEFKKSYDALSNFFRELDSTIKSVFNKTFDSKNMGVILSKRKDDILIELEKLKETILKVPEIGQNIKYWKEGLISLEKKDISTLVRSLCVQLPEYEKYDYNSESIANKYSREFGINYKDRFKDFLDMKVLELPKYKELSSEIEVIKRYLEECKNKEREVYSKNEIYKKMTGFSIAPETDHDKYWKLGYKEAGDIFYKNFENLEKDCEKKVVSGFDLIKEFSEMSVKDIINNREFGTTGLGKLDLVILEDSDRKISTQVEDDENGKYLTCGNILYFGSIRSNLSLDKIEKYMKKIGHEVRESGAGALYCTTYPSAAVQYAHLRTNQVKNSSRGEAMKTKDSGYYPTIYKITIKPGSKFLHESDTDMSRDEIVKLLKMGLVGIHSGNDEVGGGNTQESAIVNSECIKNVEKVSIEEIESISDEDWHKGSDDDKNSMIEFLKNPLG